MPMVHNSEICLPHACSNILLQNRSALVVDFCMATEWVSTFASVSNAAVITTGIFRFLCLCAAESP